MNCIYCSASVDPSRGQGDHIIPAAFGEFEGDERFRRICRKCNQKIGQAEEELIRCAPESFYRRFVNPKSSRRRGRSRTGSRTSRAPIETAVISGVRQLVRTGDDPLSPQLVDQVIVLAEDGEEIYVELHLGMRPEQLNQRINNALGDRKIKEIQISYYDERRREVIQ